MQKDWVDGYNIACQDRDSIQQWMGCRYYYVSLRLDHIIWMGARLFSVYNVPGTRDGTGCAFHPEIGM